MPLGVPKVPFLLPESEDSEDKDSNWVDLIEQDSFFYATKLSPRSRITLLIFWYISVINLFVLLRT
uniref:clp protease proteolytic subunit n=1 Tax=Limonium otolepis TaxID=1288439 RepID=UPI0021AC252B|nr:clp protease proteolytic subunit [Limonium otolepis]UUL95432.1 clp protease proteolytic subunit [Limonium otolepis]